MNPLEAHIAGNIDVENCLSEEKPSGGAGYFSGTTRLPAPRLLFYAYFPSPAVWRPVCGTAQGSGVDIENLES
jgi:hypothetical protein